MCVCPEVRRCHRATLAAILERLGAVYVGERDPTRSVPFDADRVVPPPIDWRGGGPPGPRAALAGDVPREPPPSSHRARGR